MRSCAWLICVAGCGRIGFDAGGVDSAGVLDGPAPQLLGGPLVSIDPATLPPFGTPQLVPTLSSVGSDDDDPCLTRDMLEIFFESTRGGNNQLYTSTRTSLTAPWSAPVLVAGLSSGTSEEHPQISGSGLTLYFTSSRGGEPNLWVTTRPRRDGAWTTPIEVSRVNTAEIEEMGGMDALETVMVFSSYRGGMTTNDLYESLRPSGTWAMERSHHHLGAQYPIVRSLRSPRRSRSCHVPRARRAWTSPVGVIEFASADDDSDPWLSPDLRTIYFVRDNGPDSKDIYVATR